jgi:DNA-binding NarL/FixJ family response regulator
MGFFDNFSRRPYAPIKNTRLLYAGSELEEYDRIAALFGEHGPVRSARVSGCRDASELLKTSSFDLVVAIEHLADGSGLDLARLLRSRHLSPRLGLPMVLLSDDIGAAQLETAVRAGIDVVAPRRASSKALARVIANLLANPLPITRTRSYIGPDRRRLPSSIYHGPRRRLIDRLTLAAPRYTSIQV